MGFVKRARARYVWIDVRDTNSGSAEKESNIETPTYWRIS